MNQRIPSARIHTSEPTHRAPLTQSERIRMGRVQPMATLHVSPWEARATYVVVALSIVLIVVLGVVL